MANRSIRKTRHIKLTASLRGRKSELKAKRPGLSDAAAKAKVILTARRKVNRARRPRP